MAISIKKYAYVIATLAFTSLIVTAQATKAAPEDYEFQFVENEVKPGSETIISVKLVDKRTGAPVENAVIFTTRMDMAPGGMEAMTTPVEAVSSEQPGIYRFKTDLVMSGDWRFSIAAKVQGETGTIESKLIVTAAQ